MILRKIDGNDKAIKDVEALYLRAFPESERKPLSHILENERRGVTDILSIEDGKFIDILRNRASRQGVRKQLAENKAQGLLSQKRPERGRHKDEDIRHGYGASCV